MGLVIAAAVVPGVAMSAPGFVVAVLAFAAAQTGLSWLILKLPHGYASLLLGAAGLTLTVVALWLASVLTPGLGIRGFASWLAMTLVVWLVTTIGAILLPDMYIRSQDDSTRTG